MFLTALRLEAAEPGFWKLLEPLRWDDGVHLYVVPVGFRTDLASIPRTLRWLLQQNGGSRKAAVLHDWLYREKRCSRSHADLMFYEALKAEQLNPVGRWLYWFGVRVGGWVAYRS